MKNLRERIIGERLDYCVNMIRHYHVLAKQVTFAVEESQRSFNRSQHVWSCQKARTMPGIEPSLNPSRKSLMVLSPLSFAERWSVDRQPPVLIILEGCELFRG